MFIEPNTIIRILRNVPLDTTYKHTIFFDSVTAQSDYFIGLTKHHLTLQTYQRVQKGKARVHLNAESLYDCNYMMFQNASFGNKWFYAFITGVEYINNIVSEITFEIDVMQTWHFDYNLGVCYVVRQHATMDYPGDNLETEPVDIGVMKCSNIQTTGLFDSYVAVVAQANDE